MATKAKNTIELTSREVIAGKLLASLDESDKVAVVLNREDLDALIDALYRLNQTREGPTSRQSQMLLDLGQLRSEAFPTTP